MTPRAQGSANTARPAEALYARAYGIDIADLDVEFSTTARPVLITHLLTARMRKPDGGQYTAEEIWQWTVQRRLQALLALVVATNGPHSRSEIRCPKSGCAEIMEINLDLTAFRQPSAPDSFRCSPEVGVELHLRLPRGSDQLVWLEGGIVDPTVMAKTLIQRGDETTAPDSPLPAQWIEPLETALEEHDSLTMLELEVCCPSCDAVSQVPFDLEALLLEALARAQSLLLDQFHRLARTYHWTEAEILSIPARRRADYLDRLNGVPGK